MSGRWRYIDESDVSASYGLATDEYLMLQSPIVSHEYQGSLRLYNYQNYSALCGRFQNIMAEIDIDKCIKENYDYSRRLTGGGAIIMGKGQLGICLTVPGQNLKYDSIRELYKVFSKPILKALNSIGIKAEFKSKNDLEVNEKKIAGLGIHIDVAGGIQFHTSLIVDMDILKMLEVLNIPIQKYNDKKKIFSVNQRITTINKQTGIDYSLSDIKALIKKYFTKEMNIEFQDYHFSNNEKSKIQKIESERYLNKDWIYQNSPQEDMTGMSLLKTKGGLLRTYIGLKGETIKSVLITGDFIDHDLLFRRIESKLKWSPLDKDKIFSIIKKEFSENENIYGISEQDLLHAIVLASRKAKTILNYHYEGSCYYPNKKETK